MGRKKMKKGTRVVDTREAIFVHQKTSRRFKVLSKKERRKYDAQLNVLMDEHEGNI